MIRDGLITEEKGKQEKGSPMGKQSTVIMNGEDIVRVATPYKEV